MSETNGTAKAVAPTKRTTPKKRAVAAVAAQVPEGTLRLLKVIVQPVYALDTSDGLIEVPGPVESVNGAGWAEWAQGRFTAENLETMRMSLSVIDPQ